MSALKRDRNLELTSGDKLLLGVDERLSEDVREYIDQEQRKIYIDRVPIDIQELSIKIAEKNGIELSVEETPLNATLNAEQGAEQRAEQRVALKSISGKITKKNDHEYTIEVEKSEGLHRKRFTKAHELAHLLLHRKHIGNGITENTLLRSEDISNSHETEANSLAAAILMPFYLVNMAHNSKKENAPEILARLCEVSKIAAHIRLSSYESILD